MTRMAIFCMIPTPFHEDGSLDEDALRIHIRRLAEANNAIFLSSGGAGEAQSLTVDEMRRVCEVAVAEAKGVVPVYAGLRESRTAQAMYEIARPAIEADVDAVQLYQLDYGHGMIPTLAEQSLYWKTLLDAIEHPVALSIHYEAKFRPPPAFLRDLCDRYPQIVAFNLVGSQPGYFVAVRDAIPEQIAMYVGLPEFAQGVAFGASGAINPSGNVIPYICRSIVDAYLAGDMEALSRGLRTVLRFMNIVNEWAPSTARWVKMAMKVAGTGNGVLRPPYLLPPGDDQRRMAEAFLRMHLFELEAEASAAARGVAAG